MSIDIFLIILLVVLTFFSGFFSGSETALFSLPQTKRQVYEKSSNQRERKIAELLKHPQELLVTVFMLNTLVNILLQNTASSLFGKASGWALKVGVPLIITLILGEVIPKSLSLLKNEVVSKLTANSVDFFHKSLGGVRSLIANITYPVSRIMFFFLKTQDEISNQELRHTLSTSEKKGLLTAYESHLLSGYLALKESQVKAIMRPRKEIIAYRLEDPMEKLVALFVEEKCSKVPVYEEDLDHIIGIVHVNQFFGFQKIIKSKKELLRIMEKPLYTPESTHAVTLLRQLDSLDKDIAIVVDEYGSTTGLITREDLIETVVGDIYDMRDQHAHFHRVGKWEIIADSEMELGELNALFQTELISSANMVTVGGWLQEKTGEIPPLGCQIEDDQYYFQVLEREPQRIIKLYIRRKV